MNPELTRLDPALGALLQAETNRQNNTLEMIASESIQSDTVLALQGCVFNNKTAVGLPGHQRLLGSDAADALERLYANVNPYSGSVANYCAFAACMRPGDRAVALDSPAGSHQTHGSKNNATASIYRFRYFGLDPDTMLIDYDAAERLVREYRPQMMVIGSSAYSRAIDFERLAYVAHQNGAKLLVDLAHFSGLVAAGVSENPTPFADIVTISGTKTMCGPHTGILLSTAAMADAVDRQVYPGYVSSLHLQTIAALAFALEQTKTASFRRMMRQVVANAKAMAAALQARGFGILTGGTDCHMFQVDLRPFGVDAVTFSAALEDVGISVNTKGIPFDPSPVPMGIRAGTVVLTQRGMTEKDMETVADWWKALITDDSPATRARLRAAVADLVRRFPLSHADFT